MFNIGDYVMYGTSGLCKIIDIRKENFGGKPEEYYILELVFDQSTVIYAPLENNKTPMRNVIDEDEIYSIIHSLPKAENLWLENDKDRNDRFKEILRSGDCKSIIYMIKSIYMHKLKQAEKGKKLHIADDNIIKTAEKLAYSELAYVLGIQPDDVVPFILREAYPNGSTTENIPDELI